VTADIQHVTAVEVDQNYEGQSKGTQIMVAIISIKGSGNGIL
jgi:hypothetical protein